MKRPYYQQIAAECAAKTIICTVGAIAFTVLAGFAGLRFHAPAVAIGCAVAVVLCIVGAATNSHKGSQASLRASLTRLNYHDSRLDISKLIDDSRSSPVYGWLLLAAIVAGIVAIYVTH